MFKTNFAGLTVLEPADSLSTDDYSFQALNPLIIDRLLKLGARTHRHDAHAGLVDPIDAPILTVTNLGTLPAATDIGMAYTLVDADGGESRLSPITLVTTAEPIQVPNVAPDYDVAPDGGHMLAGTYVYAITLTDGNGETPAGPSFFVDIDPGTDTNTVTITGLSDIVNSVPGATGWRLYKTTSVGQLHFLAAGGAALDNVVDDGLLCADCNTTPPTGNTTNTAQGVAFTVPATVTNAQAQIVGYRIYAAIGGNFGSTSFVEQRADVGVEQDYQQILLQPGGPPDVSTSIGGAAKIDPDTELIDWHWKRPVANAAALPEPAEEGDARFALDDGTLHVFKGGAWVTFTAPVVNWLPAVASEAALPPAGNTVGDVRLAKATRTLWWWDGGGWFSITTPQPVIQTPAGVPMAQRPNLQFVNATVEDDPANDRTVVTALGGSGESAAPLVLDDLIEWKDDQGVTRVTLQGTVESLIFTGFSDPFEAESDGGVPNWSGVNFASHGGYLLEDAGSALDTDYITARGDVAWKDIYISSGFTLDTDQWRTIGVGQYDNGLGGTEFVVTEGDMAAHLRYRAVAADPWTDIHVFALAPAPAVADHLIIGLTRRSGVWTPYLYNETQDVMYVDGATLTYPVPAPMVDGRGASGIHARFAALGAFRFDFDETNYYVDSYKLIGQAGAVPTTLATDDGKATWRPFGIAAPDWTVPVARVINGQLQFGGSFIKTTGAAPLADELMCTIDQDWFTTGETSVVVVTGDADGEELGILRLAYPMVVRWGSGRSTDPVLKSPYVRMDGVTLPA
jgi:hypothetical protein